MQQSDLHKLIQSLETKVDALSHESRQWQDMIDSKSKETEQLQQTHDTTAQRVSQLRTTVESRHSSNAQRRQQQHELESKIQGIKHDRIRCQSQVIQAEAKWRGLKAIHDNLAARYEAVRPSRDNKCAGCSERSIEFAMLPCFHFAYCEACAGALPKCTVCNEPKQGIQRIYYG